MSTITREWLQQTIAEYEANRDELPFGLDTNSAIELQAFKLALASLEAEPIYQWRPIYEGEDSWNDCTKAQYGEFAQAPDCELRILYTATPAPVSVPDYPETLPCPVMLEPVLRFGKGVPTKTMLGALQRRSEYYAELEAMTPEQRAEHDAGMKEFAAMLQGADGNSPVIPDGWVLVPVEPTEHMIVEGFESWPDEFFSDTEVWEAFQEMSGCQQPAHLAKLCWAAMIAAAPQQEA
ncbi:hypothetical protein FQX46_11040 [Salmonella enterica subsp. enterica serovar Cerro]|nr:hypothetical protein [Salmonella enterica subsp. enterica serovar Cerro]